MKDCLSSRQIGIAQVLMSGVCFGFLGVFGRWAFASGVQPEELLAHRFLLASVLLGLFLVFQKGPSAFKVSPKLLLYCGLLGTFGYAVFASFYFYAIKSLSITLAVLLLYTFPFWVVLAGWIFLKERLLARQAFVFPLAFLGLVLLIGLDFKKVGVLGVFFGVLSALTYAAYIILSRSWLQNINSLTAVFFIQFFAGLVLFIKSFQSLERTLNVIHWAWLSIFGLALVCSVFAMVLFQSGLQKIKGWEASLLSTTEPIMGIILAFFLFDESLHWQQA
ncbi:MAG: DMT family transporter, partial [Bdellovibrionales bacterium]